MAEPTSASGLGNTKAPPSKVSCLIESIMGPRSLRGLSNSLQNVARGGMTCDGPSGLPTLCSKGHPSAPLGDSTRYLNSSEQP